MTKHSPLGASGAERWMNCPGSVVLLNKLQLPESDEKDYQIEGTAMHEAAASCLLNGTDTWEIVGQKFGDTPVEITEDMADAVQVYLDHIRPVLDEVEKSYGESFVEYAISSPVHKDFYGTLDFGAVVHGPNGRIVVRDFKGGEGIRVEAENNSQIKYYAFGLIDGLIRADKLHAPPDAMLVDLGIVQGRWWDKDDRIRTWNTTWGELKAWVENELVPAMERAEVDERLDAGEWCRFCPAKLACPLLRSLFGAAARHNPKEIPNLNNDTLGWSYLLAQAAKHYIKALEEETFRRLNNGETVLKAKLVNKRANRVFKSGAKEKALSKFGPRVLSTPELLTPPALEKLGKEEAEFVKAWAFTPESGLTVALDTDNRPGVIVRSTTERLAEALAKEGVKVE